MVETVAVNNNTGVQINTADLSDGIYFLQLHAGNKVLNTQKFVKL